MEIFLALVALWLYLTLKSRKQTRKAREQQSREEKKIAAMQSDYDDYMASLPELSGPETYEIQLFGTEGLSETLDLYADWLVKTHPETREIWVIVKRDRDHEFDAKAVKVESGMTTLGYVPRRLASEFCEFLNRTGPVKASAKFQVDPYGTNHTIWLDAGFPLKLK